MKIDRIGPELENRTTNPNPAVPNSTRESWSIFQHWLHFSPFFFKWPNPNHRIWNLLTRSLFNVIRRSSNDPSHNIYRTGQCNSTMMIPDLVYFWLDVKYTIIQEEYTIIRCKYTIFNLKIYDPQSMFSAKLDRIASKSENRLLADRIIPFSRSFSSRIMFVNFQF